MKSQVSKKKSILVGLSGGVDSSVSAALLQKEGYDVTGVFIKIWSPEWTECTSKEDRLDAMRVCAHLGISFKEIDLTEEYKREVVDYMISEYAKGRTPNPDVMCNRAIKFGTFFKWAIAHGADFVATGHYARIGNRVQGIGYRKNERIKKTEDSTLYSNPYTLLAAKDEGKDQSYFLWTLRQEQLARTLFPIGHLKKTQVRILAKKFGLLTAEKKDSQGLCFVGHVDIKEFLSRYVPKKRGDVLNEQGKVIGYHDGAHLLTIGERHGFTVTTKTALDKPLYITNKNIANNTITVAKKIKPFDISKGLIPLSSPNWINGFPKVGAIYEAQIRYHGKRYHCRINENKVEFIDKPEALASGQSLVAYDKETCLGGGVMEKVM